MPNAGPDICKNAHMMADRKCIPSALAACNNNTIVVSGGK